MNTSGLPSSDKNFVILKKVWWYVLGIIALVCLVWQAQYWITGTVTAISGAVVGIIIYQIRRITTNYDYKHPLWFRSVLIFAGIILTFCGMLMCRELSRYLYEISYGHISPGILFVMMALLMIALFVWANKQYKKMDMKSSRVYALLMVLSVSLIIAQCGGSLTFSDEMKYLQERGADTKTVWSEKDIIGTWVIEVGSVMNILGKQPMVEIFRADGSWQSGQENGIISKGEWVFKNKVLTIRQTGISAGSTIEHADYVIVYDIVDLTSDQMVCKRGEYTIVFMRMKDN